MMSETRRLPVASYRSSSVHIPQSDVAIDESLSKGNCLKKEIMQGTMPGARRRVRPRTAWIDNIKSWSGLSVEEPIRMTEDRDKWRKCVHGVANPRLEEG